MEFLIHLGILVGIYALLGLSLNLVVGYTGCVSLCQAAFCGVGAYATAILTTRFGWSLLSTIPASIAVAMVLSWVSGIVLSSLQGDRYTLGSLAFGTIIANIFLNGTALTRGALGIAQIPRPMVFGVSLIANRGFLFFVLGSLLVVWVVCLVCTETAFGLVVRSIREDESALQVFGYKTERYKQAIFAVSAGIAALAGSMLASYVTFIEPSMFFLTESIFLLTLVILGGLASHTGSVTGAVALILLPEALRFVGLSGEQAAQIRQMLYGVGLILLLYRRPQGLLGTYVLRS